MASQFKTFVAGDALTASELNTYLMKQAVIVCDSSADYPTSPLEGMLVYDKALDSYFAYTGSAWVQVAGVGAAADTAYTPTLTQSAAVAATVTTANYVRYGNVVEAWVKLDVTGTGTSGQAVIVTLPVTAATLANGCIIGEGAVHDGTTVYNCQAFLRSSTTVGFMYQSETEVGGSPAFALAAGDEVRFHVRYLAA